MTVSLRRRLQFVRELRKPVRLAFGRVIPEYAVYLALYFPLLLLFKWWVAAMVWTGFFWGYLAGKIRYYPLGLKDAELIRESVRKELELALERERKAAPYN